MKQKPAKNYSGIAEMIVDLILNPKCERADAIAILIQALQTAHSSGAWEAANEVGNSMLQTFDKAIGTRGCG